MYRYQFRVSHENMSKETEWKSEKMEKNENSGKYRKKNGILLLSTVGGFIPQFELHNVRLLREKGYRVFYGADFTNPMYTGHEGELEELGVKQVQLPIKKSPLALKAHRAVLRELIFLVEQEDISCVHCHTPVGGFLGRMLGRHFGGNLKVIYTAHGFHFYKGAPIQNWLFYPVEAFLAHYTDALVTVNSEDYECAGRFRLRRGGKVYQIPGAGIRMEWLEPDAGDAGIAWRKEHGIPESAFHLVTAGELNRNKNQRIILEAIKLLQKKGGQGADLYCSIAGRGPLEEELRRQILESGLSNRIQLVGYQNRIASILKSADAFLFPSRREGLGMAALEAMAAGLPVIAADNRGTREYMRDGFNGYVFRWNDAGGLAAVIEKLWKDPGKREAMGRAARETAGRFTKERSAKVMGQVYAEALGWN